MNTLIKLTEFCFAAAAPMLIEKLTDNSYDIIIKNLWLHDNATTLGIQNHVYTEKDMYKELKRLFPSYIKRKEMNNLDNSRIQIIVNVKSF